MIIQAFLALLSDLNLSAEYLEYTGPLEYPYFVFEISENEIRTEDGMQSGYVKMSGWSRESASGLEQAKEAIKTKTKYGASVKTDAGVVSFLYGGASTIPTGEAGLKRIEINLEYTGWEV